MPTALASSGSLTTRASTASQPGALKKCIIRHQPTADKLHRLVAELVKQGNPPVHDRGPLALAGLPSLSTATVERGRALVWEWCRGTTRPGHAGRRRRCLHSWLAQVLDGLSALGEPPTV